MSTNFYLTPMLGGPGAPRYPVSDAVQLIGRSEHSNIGLFEPTVSRRHATIRVVDGAVVLEDLGSKHGTYVNSRRVTHVRLKEGDIVVFGLSLVLRLEASAVPIPPADPLQLPFGESTPIAALDDSDITAIRRVPDGGPRERRITSATFRQVGDLAGVQQRIAQSRDMAEVGALCVAILPDVATRLRELRQTLASAHEQTGALDRSELERCLGSVATMFGELETIMAAIRETTCGVTVPLGDVVDEVRRELNGPFERKRVRLRVSIDPGCTIRGSRLQATSVLTSLLDYGCRVAPDDSSVEVIGVKGRRTSLTINVLGELPRDSVEPANEALGRAELTVSAIGGTLQIERKQDAGLTLRVTLPAG